MRMSIVNPKKGDWNIAVDNIYVKAFYHVLIKTFLGMDGAYEL